MQTRIRSLSVIRALLRREGIRVPSGSAAAFPRRLQQVAVPPTQAAVEAPLVELLTPLNAAIAAANPRVARRAAADAVSRRLATALGSAQRMAARRGKAIAVVALARPACRYPPRDRGLRRAATAR
jgi:hypothetical protein